MYLITFILTIIVFCAIDNTYSYLQKTFTKNTSEVAVISQNNYIHTIKQATKDIKLVENGDNINIAKVSNTWQIEIPSIGLIAPIEQGTSQDVLYTFVGHFEHTGLFDGNVGLAAHNRRISYKLF